MAVMIERNYMSDSAEECTGMHSNRTIKDGMGGSLISRAGTVNQYKKSGKKVRKI